MKPKKITITLTFAEARYLWTAASQVLGHSDAEEATFQHKSHRDAAYRAADKIQAALHPDNASPTLPGHA